MRRIAYPLATLAAFLALLSLVFDSIASAQEGQKTNVTDGDFKKSGSPLWRFTTREYQQAAIDVLIAEANRVARVLDLKEPTPITRSNLLEASISPPALGMFGMISTTNYAYYASAHKRFSGLDQRNYENTFEEARVKYRWPMQRMDTNAALLTASNMLAKAGMDAAKLMRDFPVDVRASFPDGSNGKTFLPIYWVSWMKNGECIAKVQFLEPTKTIRSLSVEDRHYILSNPLLVPNITEILKRGNAPDLLLQKMGLIPDYNGVTATNDLYLPLK